MNNSIIQKAIDIAGSQNRLAELSGVSQAAIHKLLTGKSKSMNTKTLFGISRATGIPVDEFSKEQSHPQPHD